jgi:hypothetical protein
VKLTFLCLFQTSLLQGHLGRNLRYLATLEKEHLSSFTINTVQVYGQEKYLMVSNKHQNHRGPVVALILR